MWGLLGSVNSASSGKLPLGMALTEWDIWQVERQLDGVRLAKVHPSAGEKTPGLCWEGLCPGLELVQGRAERQRAARSWRDVLSAQGVQLGPGGHLSFEGPGPAAE